MTDQPSFDLRMLSFQVELETEYSFADSKGLIREPGRLRET